MKGGERMKRAIVLTGFLVVLLVAVLAYAQGPGMMGGGQGWNYCPYCGQNLGQGGGYGMMGPGMMGGGYGMGPGMMGRGMMGGGYGMGPGMMGGWHDSGGYGMGPGMMGPGYSQQNEACQKFFDDTAGMRKIYIPRDTNILKRSVIPKQRLKRLRNSKKTSVNSRKRYMKRPLRGAGSSTSTTRIMKQAVLR